VRHLPKDTNPTDLAVAADAVLSGEHEYRASPPTVQMWRTTAATTALPYPLRRYSGAVSTARSATLSSITPVLCA